jgi:hypothetical protein
VANAFKGVENFKGRKNPDPRLVGVMFSLPIDRRAERLADQDHQGFEGRAHAQVIHGAKHDHRVARRLSCRAAHETGLIACSPRPAGYTEVV